VTGRPVTRSESKSRARRTTQHLVAGRIVRPHGVRGLVVVEASSDVLQRVQPGLDVRLGVSGRKARLLSLQPHQGRYLLTLEGVTTREQAETLRGESLELKLEDVGPLPEGVFFRWQIVGLRAVTDEGTELGEIVEVFSTGANDVYEVQRPDGSRVLLPAISSVVRQIDLEGGVVHIHLLPGLIDPA
jgi:16S rRNA processing protein RimM